MAENRTRPAVTLGCGTLVLIALIIMAIVRPGFRDLEQEVQGLRTEVGELRKAVEAQAEEIRMLRKQLGKGGE
ncbi:MAG TPA: hypothetical protein VIL46_00850 [Gemmataceae bacterium]